MAPVDSLPSEILEAVLTNLKNKSDLILTSLVSSRWCHIAQPLYFSHTRIQPARTEGLKDVPSFTEFLRLSPHIGRLVKTLTLVGDDRGSGQSRLRIIINRTLLADLLSHLPRLRSLDLLGIRFGTSALTDPCATFSLEKLSLDDVDSRTGNVMDLLNCLGLFTHIGTLSVQYASFNETISSNEIAPHVLCGLSVENLQLSHMGLLSADWLCSLFRHSSMSNTLHTFSFDPFEHRITGTSRRNKSALPGICDLLANASPTLHSLEVYMLQATYPPSLDRLGAAHILQQCFSSLNAVRTCNINLVVLGITRSPEIYRQNWSNFMKMLSILPRNVQYIELFLSDLTLEVMKVGPLPSSFWTISGFDVHALEPCLLKFSQLTTVRFCSCYGIGAEEEKALSDACPQLSKRGALRFN